MKDKDSNCCQNENAKTEQLQEHSRCLGETLTTNQGLPISDNQNSLKAGERGPSLLEDFHLREKITHFDHERIPERVVHARGSAAHGYFEVYESMKEYTRAAFLQDPSLKTPVFVRFSTVAGFRGSADTVRDVRGFATKFYTSEGNFDLVGNNIPVFFVQDAIKFPDFVHSVKPEPHNEIPQASSAHDNFWDFISLTPESLHMIMWVMSDRALPRSYSMMEGFGVHTFRLVNEQMKSRFVKFHWKPLGGIHSVRFEEAQIIAGKDPDYNRRDLWDSIEAGIYPEYELGIQILEEDELAKVEFDILDPTKIWPEEDVPVLKIGKLTLNRNPDNFFAETEQVAFHPGNLVAGIDITNDPLLQGRLFSYIDTQLTRLGGPNFHEIPINRPLAKVHNNQQDGFMRQTIDKGRVNYEPNTLGGGCPMQAGWKKGGFVTYPEHVEGDKIRKRAESFGDHYTQATLFWNSMSKAEKRHITEAFKFELGKVEHKHIKEKMVEHLQKIHHDLAAEVAKGLGIEKAGHLENSKYTKKSPALSQNNHQPDSVKGRKIAILAAPGVCVDLITQAINFFKSHFAVVDVIAKDLGKLVGRKDKTFEIKQNFATTDSVLYDAVLIPGGTDQIKDLMQNFHAKRFIKEAYLLAKPIAALGQGIEILEDALKDFKSLPNDPGIIKSETGDDCEQFLEAFRKAISQHRVWEREELFS